MKVVQKGDAEKKDVPEEPVVPAPSAVVPEQPKQVEENKDDKSALPEDSKLSEAETYTVIARSVSDKAVADRIAQDKQGRVISDEEDPKKFMVVVGQKSGI